MPSGLVVVVYGIPAPQGSKRHVGHGILVESSAKVKPWRALVTAATRASMDRTGWRPERRAPMVLHAVFTFTRPASHYRTGKWSDYLRDDAPEWPAGRPDIDKLIRSTLDALVDAGALTDDARVVRVVADKAYPGGALDSLDTPGAVLHLRER